VPAVATAARQVMTIELLYQIGVNLNCTTKAGRTALLVAVNKDLLDVADRLIDLGCDVNQENDHGQTPLLVRTPDGRRRC
jgi:ankyrin repeat protein